MVKDNVKFWKNAKEALNAIRAEIEKAEANMGPKWVLMGSIHGPNGPCGGSVLGVGTIEEVNSLLMVTLASGGRVIWLDRLEDLGFAVEFQRVPLDKLADGGASIDYKAVTEILMEVIHEFTST